MAALGTAIQLPSTPSIVPVGVQAFIYTAPFTYYFGVVAILANEGLGGSTESCHASAPVSPVLVWDATLASWVPTPALVWDAGTSTWVPA